MAAPAAFLCSSRVRAWGLRKVSCVTLLARSADDRSGVGEVLFPLAALGANFPHYGSVANVPMALNVLGKDQRRGMPPHLQGSSLPALE